MLWYKERILTLNLGGFENLKRKLMDEAKRDWVGWGLSSISTILMIKVLRITKCVKLFA